MKKFNLVKTFAVSVLMVVSSFAQAQTIDKADEVATDEFSSVTISVPATIQFVQSDTYTISVIADDAELAKGIKYIVDNEDLKLGLDLGMNAEELNDKGIVIVISAPSMPDLKLGKDFEMM